MKQIRDSGFGPLKSLYGLYGELICIKVNISAGATSVASFTYMD